jgi:hypothetical protein
MQLAVPMGTDTIGDETGSFGEAGGTQYWIEIDGIVAGKVRRDSVLIDQSARDESECSFVLLDPPAPPLAGQVVHFIERGFTHFGGIIQSVELFTGRDETVFEYRARANGWEVLSGRNIFSNLYTNVSVGTVLRSLLSAGGLGADGIFEGVIDEGALLLIADAQNVRLSDFIREVGDAGGGIAFIDQHKALNFRVVNLDVSPIALDNEDIEATTRLDDLDNYRNRQMTKVTSLDGATSTVMTRDSLSEQAERSSLEGGTGVYEAYEEVRHPTSNVLGDLEIYGNTVNFLKLRALGHVVTKIHTRLRTQLLQLAQLVSIDFPAYALPAQVQVMRRRIQEADGGAYLFEYDLSTSSFEQAYLESLLKIVGAAKSDLMIGTVFPNSQLFSTPGNFQWEVPAGVTVAEFTCVGGSGGGGGAATLFNQIQGCFFHSQGNGGTGGNSGKAVTILDVTPAQVFDLVIGAKGAKGVKGSWNGACEGGVNPTSGAAGTLSSSTLSAVLKCRGDGGGGGRYGVNSSDPATDGTPGSGVGDAVSVGGGKLGGTKGISGGAAAGTGLDGYIEVRW